MLPTLIYVRLAATGPAILSEVAVLSIIVALIGVAALALQLVATRRARMRLAARPGAPLALALGRWRPAIEVAAWTYMALILVLPLVSLVTTSLLPAYGVPFGPATATFDNYAEVLFRQAATIRAFWNSLWLSLAAAAITAALALPLAYFVVWKESRFAAVLSGAAEVPYALPGVVLAIALILVFLRPLPVIEVALYGTVWILLVAYLARFFVLALKPAVAASSSSTRASTRPRASRAQASRSACARSCCRSCCRPRSPAASSCSSPPSTSSPSRRCCGPCAPRRSAS